MIGDGGYLNLGSGKKTQNNQLPEKLSMHCLEIMQKKRMREKVQYSASNNCNPGRIFPKTSSRNALALPCKSRGRPQAMVGAGRSACSTGSENCRFPKV